MFAYPTGLWKVLEMVPFGCSDLFASMYCFDWSKISFKLFVQALFCWFLTCVYFIQWISAHWSLNLSLGMLANCLLAVSKLDIHLCSPHKFLEGSGEGDGSVISLAVINWLTGFKSIIKNSSNWFWWLRYVGFQLCR